jgi:integrase/recombinase XerD
MPATFKPTLRPKPNADGRYAILIRITYARIQRYVPTGFLIKEKQWNPKASYDKRNWVRESCDMADTYNTHIKGKIDRWTALAAELEQEGKPLSADILKGLAGGKSEDVSQSVIPFIFAELDNQKGQVGHRTWERRYRHSKELEKDHPDLKWSDLTLKWLKDYESKLLLKRARNTVSKQLELLKSMIKKAIAAGLMAYPDNPFLNHKLKFERTTKEKLTVEEINTLAAYPLASNLKAFHARNVFLFQYYLAGARIADILTLKWANIKDGRVRYTTMKTGKALSVPLAAEALAILEHYKRGKGYVFPFMDDEADYTDPVFFYDQLEAKTTKINYHLRELAKKAGIEKHISSHVSRHSFTHNATKAKVSIYDISKSLGHSDLKTTEVYTKELDEESLDHVISTMFPEPKK